MGIKVSFKIVSKDSEFTLSENKDELVPAYHEGQIIFSEGLQKIFLDFHDTRTCYASGISDVPTGVMNYLGLSDTDPTKKPVEVNGQVITPKPNDMVVYGTKEYLYRNGDNGTGWYEIGDEDSPGWNF